MTGILLTFEWGLICVLGQLCKNLPRNQKSVVGVVYYGFYGALLLTTMTSKQWDLVGLNV